jgi:hypothetical protein
MWFNAAILLTFICNDCLPLDCFFYISSASSQKPSDESVAFDGLLQLFLHVSHSLRIADNYISAPLHEVVVAFISKNPYPGCC